MDLALLTTTSNGTTTTTTTTNTTTTKDTIACFRLSGSTPQVWSVPINTFFTENSWCVDLVGQPIEIDQSSNYDQIDALHWSPDGQCLVAALSSKSSSTRPPAFILLSVHSGQLLSFPTLITSTDHSNNESNLFNFIEWLPLPLTKHSDQNLPQNSSIPQELCDRLPANLTIPQLKNLQTIRNYMGPVYTSNQSKVTGKLYDHYPMIRFPPSLITDPHQPKQCPTASSLLILSSHVNKLHFFLNGTVYLGTTSFPDQVQLVGVHILPGDAPSSIPLDALHRGGICLKLVWLNSNNSIGFGTLDLLPSLLSSAKSSNKPPLLLNLFQVKPSLSVVGINSKELNRQVQLSNEIQSLLKDCFFAYFGIVKDWHVARATGKKWYENFNDLSKAHNVTAPISFQMLELLFLGQSNEGLRDYLGTKSGERTFTKWETTVLGNLTRIRLAIIELLIPATERLYILVTELRLHTYAPFSSIQLIEDDDFETLLLVESLIRYLIKSIHRLDKLVKEEETLFGHFCKWLRSEFDYVIALESSPTPPNRPQIKYDLMAISNFIQRGESNSLDKMIFPQFPTEAEDLKYLQETKDHLAKKYYNEFYDLNGTESRTELKKKLSALLPSQNYDDAQLQRDDMVNDTTTTEPPRHHHQHHLTPDISHVQKSRPNAQFQTPNLAEHLKRQSEVLSTPSNSTMYKLPSSSSPSVSSNLPSNYNFLDSSSSEFISDTTGGETKKNLGIYPCLTYTSSFISNVFQHFFTKISLNKSILNHHLIHSSSSSLLKPIHRKISSRFIDNMHYSGFIAMNREEGGNEVLVIDRIEQSTSTTPNDNNNPMEISESQVIIPLKLSINFFNEHDSSGGSMGEGEGSNMMMMIIQVLDLDFFDDVEFVLLVSNSNSCLDSSIDVGYFIVTIKFKELFINSFQQHQKELTSIPVNRIQRLNKDFKPNKISLNGSLGRRTGCVTSANGLLIHVFDMET